MCVSVSSRFDSCSDVLTLTFYRLCENRQKTVMEMGREVISFYEINWYSRKKINLLAHKIVIGSETSISILNIKDLTEERVIGNNL